MSEELQDSRSSDVPGSSASAYERFEHGPFILEYLRFGNGPRPVIAFHGYGRKAEDFALFAPHLRPDITLYSFNLFGHGRSQYPEERIERNSIDKEEWAGIFRAFLDRIGAESTSLLGYSLGGKIALCLLERMPERIEGAYLFAPDGLHRFSWYRWAGRIPLVRKLLKRQIEHPALLFRTFRILRQSRLIDGRTASFLQRHIRTEAQRKAVHRIWNIHRDLDPDPKKIRKLMQLHPFRLRSIFGSKDPVIRPENGKLLGMKDPKGGYINHTLPKGHLLLDEECIFYLKDLRSFDDPAKLFS